MKKTTEATKGQTSKTTTATEPKAAKAKKATPASATDQPAPQPAAAPACSESVQTRGKVSWYLRERVEGRRGENGTMGSRGEGCQ